MAGMVRSDEGTSPAGNPLTGGLSPSTIVLLLVGAAAAAIMSLTVSSATVTSIPDLPRMLLSVAAGGVLAGMWVAGFVVRPMLRARVDLTERYQEALADALRDPLTRLGNHRAFHEELDRQVEEAKRAGLSLSLVLIDLDQFKQVNDSFGHADGDRTLASFGALVASVARRADQAFRLGGDEFALLLPDTESEPALVFMRRLLVASLEPGPRDALARSISFSAGISTFPTLASSRPQLYAEADAALYAAKRNGRTDVTVFDPSVVVEEDAVGVGASITELLARGQLRPVYQPIVDLATGAVLGWEGLIRPVPPARFADPTSLFAAAEATGQVVDLDFACLEKIIGGAHDLPESVFLSVNLSPRTLESPEFSVTALLTLLSRHGVPPERVVIELTERQTLDDVNRARVKLDACRRAGIRLAADDLGAGNAGLRLLSDLRFDIVKVDLGLVQGSTPGGRTSAVVESIVAFAERTGALVIGEGVEEIDQIEQLISLGVTAAQGYLLGRPGPLGESAPIASSVTTGVAELRAAALARDDDIRAWRQSLGLPVNPIFGG